MKNGKIIIGTAILLAILGIFLTVYIGGNKTTASPDEQQRELEKENAINSLDWKIIELEKQKTAIENNTSLAPTGQGF
jgi:hypothetical protein